MYSRAFVEEEERTEELSWRIGFGDLYEVLLSHLQRSCFGISDLEKDSQRLGTIFLSEGMMRIPER